MLRFKANHLFLVLGLIAPLGTFAANFCIAVSGGFGGGGTSYIAPVFTLPTANKCTPWAGFTKTASTVIAFASGTACLASNGKVLTFSIFNTDPSFFGAGSSVSDQITMCPNSVTGCTITGEDQGNFSGSAAEETCTATLLKLPVVHD
jgi:hypothetical protein